VVEGVEGFVVCITGEVVVVEVDVLVTVGEEITLQSKPEKVYFIGIELKEKEIKLLHREGTLFFKQVKVRFYETPELNLVY
jgi:hypothetical protein